MQTSKRRIARIILAILVVFAVASTMSTVALATEEAAVLTATDESVITTGTAENASAEELQFTVDIDGEEVGSHR